MKWKTIDSAPRDGRWFIAYSEDAYVPIICMFDIKAKSFTGFSPNPGKEYSLTHWAPLPEPPK